MWESSSLDSSSKHFLNKIARSMEWATRGPDGGHPVLGLRVRGTAGPRTTSPGGQLVLGPHVRGDSQSSDTLFSKILKETLLALFWQQHPYFFVENKNANGDLFLLRAACT